MKAERWKRVREIFAGALAHPEADREDYLNDACLDDPGLLAELKGLLAAESAPNALLDGVALDALPGDFSAHDLPTREGRTIGRYRLGRRLGVGGMGEVYRAERTDFAQSVALKLLRTGVVDHTMVKRLEQERTILAQLEHPNIARLYDGGVSEDGIPYFTMELVEGLPIDQYCERHDLPLAAMIRLFREVCGAVRYAQEHLIVHRDLKPGNILVTHDGTVKLLDFGIARVLAEGDKAQVLATLTGRFQPLTLAFAAPEQIRGEAVTTATDVYALGMVFYQLLCGERPYRVPDSTPHALEHAITTTTPDLPSLRVSVPRQSRRLRGDLDNICMKALRKEPERRYASAAELDEDLANYCAQRPVKARKDANTYRMSKFVQRNRRALVPVALAVVVIAVLMTTYTVRLSSERDLAREERARAEELSELLIDIFSAADPSAARKSELSAKELLDRGSRRIGQRLQNQPDRRARFEFVLGRLYRGLGEFATSAELLSRAQESHESLGDPLASAEARLELSLTLAEIGRMADAESLASTVVVQYRAHLSPDDERVCNAVAVWGWALHNLGHYEAAERAYREAGAIALRAGYEKSADAFGNQNNLALLYVDTDRLEKSRALYESLLAGAPEYLGDDHPEYSTALYNYSDLLHRLGDRAGARTALLKVLAADEKNYGSEHPMLGFDYLGLGKLQQPDGLIEEARASFQLALDLFQAADPKYSEIPVALSHLGRIAQAREEFDLAEDYYRRSLVLHRELHGPEHAYIPIRLNDIGSLQLARGELAASEATLRDALARNLEMWSDEHSQVGQTRYLLAKTLSARGQHEAAVNLARQSLVVAEQNDIGGLNTLRQRLGLADVLLAAGEIESARRFYARCDSEYAGRLGLDDLQRSVALFGLGECASELGSQENALGYHGEALRIREKRLPNDSPELRSSRARIEMLRGAK